MFYMIYPVVYYEKGTNAKKKGLYVDASGVANIITEHGRSLTISEVSDFETIDRPCKNMAVTLRSNKIFITDTKET